MNQRQRAKECVAQTRRLRLHDITDRDRMRVRAIIFDNVRLTRPDNETNARGAADHQAFDQVVAHRPRPLHAAIAPSADRQQFLRKRQRLNAAALPGCRNDSPHWLTPEFVPSPALGYPMYGTPGRVPARRARCGRDPRARSPRVYLRSIAPAEFRAQVRKTDRGLPTYH